MLSTFFHNKVIFISGGTDGLGKELVNQLLIYGALVGTCGRDNKKIQNLKKEYSFSKNLLVLKGDIQKKTDCSKIMQATLSYFKKIDILINNAGLSMRSTFVDVDIDTIIRLMNTNFLGTVYLTKMFLPHIIKTKGIITAISSVAGLRGIPGRTGYCASKFALHGFMESLRVEMFPYEVKVLWFSPGFFASNIRKRAEVEKGKKSQTTTLDESKLMTTQQCAKIILQGIKRKKRHTVLTLLGKVTYFTNKFFPSFVDTRTYKLYYQNKKLYK